MSRRLSAVTRTGTRWVGGWVPTLASLAIVVGAVVLIRTLGTGPGTTLGTGAAPGGAAPIDTSLANPSPDSFASRTVRVSVRRSEPVDAAAPVPITSFPNAALLSVSPDGRWALIRANLGSLPEVDLVAVPLAGGEPISLGVAGWEPRPPADSEIRLALPAWSIDSSAVAFENGSKGTIASLVGAPTIEFTSTSDGPITALSGGGFLINTSRGPQVVAGTTAAALAGSAELQNVSYFPDGSSLVGTDEAGDLVWTNGSDRAVVARLPEYSFPLAWKLLSRSAGTLAFAPEVLQLQTVYLVDSDGSVTVLELSDPCGAPALSDDGAFAAYHICDRSVDAAGSAAYYSLRVVRLSDGAAVDLGPGALEPAFLPGTHRLVWLALSGDPPVQSTFTLVVATNEVLP